MGRGVQDILDFWYGEPARGKWFAKDEAFDALIRERFLISYEQAIKHKLKPWEETADGMLALIILLDQFPRNMFRDTPRMFESDEYACLLVYKAIENRWDEAMNVDKRRFLYMPLMHSERLADQEYAVTLFTRNVDEYSAEFARKHMEIIKEYGRFPHRNAVMGRTNTAREEAFLKQPGSSF